MGAIVEHTLRLGQVETRALELDGEGTPLLLLHGFADSADTWRLVIDRLRKRGRAALAVDFPGFGRASRLDRDEPVLPQLDRFVADAVTHVATGRGVVISGNSLGGCAALRAAQNPELPIEGIVPIAPAGLDHQPWLRIIEQAPLVRALIANPAPLPEAVVRGITGRLYRVFAFSKPRTVDPGVVAAFTGHMPSRRDTRRILATGQRVYPELTEPDCFSLGEITCPVLVIWGDRDRMVKASGAERLLAELPGARLELLEGQGHCPQIEVPDRIAELISEFPAVRAAA